jgi:hypothetical protein
MPWKDTYLRNGLLLTPYWLLFNNQDFHV